MTCTATVMRVSRNLLRLAVLLILGPPFAALAHAAMDSIGDRLHQRPLRRVHRIVPGQLAMAVSLLLPVVSAADSISRAANSSKVSKSLARKCQLRSAKATSSTLSI